MVFTIYQYCVVEVMILVSYFGLYTHIYTHTQMSPGPRGKTLQTVCNAQGPLGNPSQWREVSNWLWLRRQTHPNHVTDFTHTAALKKRPSCRSLWTLAEDRRKDICSYRRCSAVDTSLGRSVGSTRGRGFPPERWSDSTVGGASESIPPERHKRLQETKHFSLHFWNISFMNYVDRAVTILKVYFTDLFFNQVWFFLQIG